MGVTIIEKLSLAMRNSIGYCIAVSADEVIE
jgi:hypothetical protein